MLNLILRKGTIVKKIFFMIALLIIPLLFSGCGMKNRAYETYILDVDWANEPDVKETINQSIIDLADQLLLTSKIDKKSKVTITSFVDLHQLNKTTHFGRKVSESFFSELHKRGLSLVDARGTKSIRVNADGEFFITRDIKLLNNKRFENSYILVGTYTRFGKGVMINVRILDNQTGDVVSVGRSIIDINYCDIFENCPKKETEKKDEIIVKKTAEVKVVDRKSVV